MKSYLNKKIYHKSQTLTLVSISKNKSFILLPIPTNCKSAKLCFYQIEND